MPLEMDDEKAEAKSGHYQYYFYQQPASEAEDMSAAASGENKPVAEYQFPKFSPRLYFLILIPPWDKINLTLTRQNYNQRLISQNNFGAVVRPVRFRICWKSLPDSSVLHSRKYDVMVNVPVVAQVLMIT